MSDPIDWFDPKNQRKFLAQFQALSRSLNLPSQSQIKEILTHHFGFDLAQMRQMQFFLASQFRQQGLIPANAPSVAAAPRETKPKSVRWKASIGTHAAARRMEAYIETKGMDFKEFARRAGTTDRTLRKFRTTGLVRRSVFDEIAKTMGLTRDELLKS